MCDEMLATFNGISTIKPNAFLLVDYQPSYKPHRGMLNDSINKLWFEKLILVEVSAAPAYRTICSVLAP
jgi:hypothetical protein